MIYFFDYLEDGSFFPLSGALAMLPVIVVCIGTDIQFAEKPVDSVAL